MPNPRPDLLAPLDPAACPLLTKYGGAEGNRLLERFNAVLEEVRQSGADRLVGPMLATEKFAGVL
jgi:hypothetical protein